MNPLLLDIPELLETERLVLRCPRAGDGAMLYTSVCATLAELKVWMPWARDDYAQLEAEEWCRRAAANFIKREELSFLILARASQHHVGNITALRFDWSVPRCEIGYWLRSGYTGRGYMTEAVNELARMARDTLKCARIEVRMDEQNERSWRVAERCGFTLEGTLRHDFRYPDSRLRDTRVYSKIK